MKKLFLLLLAMTASVAVNAQQDELDSLLNAGYEITKTYTDEEIETLVAKCSRGGKITLGAMEILKTPDMIAIYRLANA